MTPWRSSPSPTRTRWARSAGTKEAEQVVALDGQALAYDGEKEGVDKPILEGGRDRAIRAHERCSFPLLGADVAECQRGGSPADVPSPPLDARERAKVVLRRSDPKDRRIAAPPDAFALAAPATFTWTTRSKSPAVVTAVGALFSVGLLALPDGSETSSFTLVATQRGPDGMPEALPDPPR